MNIVERLFVIVLGWTFGIGVLMKLIKDTICLGYSVMWGKKTRSKPEVLSDPTLGTHGFLTLEDVKIHYVASGPEDKPLMLFLHGFPEFWYSWRNQIREFKKDFRVVAIDQRGYGESDKPVGADEYTIQKLTGDIKQVILALGYKKCVLVAHDWGGLVAWRFSWFFPDMVDKLIAMNIPTKQCFDKVLTKQKEQQKMSWYMFFHQMPYVPELVMKSHDFIMFENFHHYVFASIDSTTKAIKSAEMKQEDIEAYKYTFSQPGALTPPLNWYRALFKPSPIYDNNFAMPLLLIWGENDPYLHPDLVVQMKEDIPKLEIKSIPNAGHFVQMDVPDDVNKAMRDWLNRQT